MPRMVGLVLLMPRLRHPWDTLGGTIRTTKWGVGMLYRGARLSFGLIALAFAGSAHGTNGHGSRLPERSGNLEKLRNTRDVFEYWLLRFRAFGHVRTPPPVASRKQLFKGVAD